MPTSVCFDHLINIIDDALLSNVKESGGGGMGGLVDALDPQSALRSAHPLKVWSMFRAFG